MGKSSVIDIINGEQDLRKDIENGRGLGAPDGILFNGRGPYRYDTALVPDSIDFLTLNVEPGKILNDYVMHHAIIYRLQNVCVHFSLSYDWT